MLQRQDVNYPRYEGMEEFSALFCLSIQASWHSWCFLAALLQLINYDKTRAEGKRSSRFEMTFSILTGRKGDRIWQWCRQSLQTQSPINDSHFAFFTVYNKIFFLDDSDFAFLQYIKTRVFQMIDEMLILLCCMALQPLCRND